MGLIVYDSDNKKHKVSTEVFEHDITGSKTKLEQLEQKVSEVKSTVDGYNTSRVEPSTIVDQIKEALKKGKIKRTKTIW